MNMHADVGDLPDPSVAALAQVRAPWAAVAAAAADSKLGVATLVLDVGAAISITDFFVISSGNSRPQVRAIVEHIERQIKLVGGPTPLQIEGLDALDWVLMDYGDFLAHIFLAEVRDFYQLERLWKDCPLFEWTAMIKSEVEQA